MDDFIKTTRKFGRNLYCVQGAGGNASIKIGKKIYIKASGELMKNITQNSGIVCLHYVPLSAFIKQKKTYTTVDEQTFLKNTTQYIIQKESFGKPSMEVGFHTVIPSKYVFHLHSIYTNILSCSKNNESLIATILRDREYAFLDYYNPGYELALKIAHLKNVPTLLILKNHGLIVHGNSLTECENIIEKIHTKIKKYLIEKRGFEQFEITKKINLPQQFIFPDSAVFSSISLHALPKSKKQNVYEIVSAQNYIVNTIERLSKNPVYLKKSDVTKLLAMEQEKHRINLLTVNTTKSNFSKMKIIAHRINTIAQLKTVPTKYGVEIDIRETGGKLILNHEAFGTGELLDTYLKEFIKGGHTGTVIFNIKEAGIEAKVMEFAKKYTIRDYFLLDVEAPYLYAGSRKGVHKMAVRYSEVEPIETLAYYKGRVDWVWIDTVSKLPLSKPIIKKMDGFKTCLVCPERWGRPEDIAVYRKKMRSLGFTPTAVMTSLKYIAEWEK